ncbi:MAG: sigma 54-interacting transcriptional regulator [Gammaproteobacteria bacterium]
MDRSRVLLVDDDPGLLKLLSFRLRSAGYDVEAVDSGRKALGKLEVFQPQVVITDLRMDGMDGLALFDSIQAEKPSLPVIILTAHGTIPDAVAATQRGLHGFFTKPCDSDRLLGCVDKALRQSGVTEQSDDDGWSKRIVTRSPNMLALLERARLAARSEASILIVGDSGTGKELLARAIHSESHRAEHEFVAINCTAVPEALLESELFGHKKGSFTGAIDKHHGLIRTADGGTLFLDEIGDMPLAFQARLLRVLQEKEVRPIGEAKSVPVDTRVISATHHDLEKATRNGDFREDLYYRLNVVRLKVPPLSSRREDIPLLVRHFLERLAEKSEAQTKEFAPDAMDTLLAAPWPGNVRQLQNVVEQTVALCTTPVIPKSLVANALNQDVSEMPTLNEARSRFERQYLVRVLRTTQGNVSHAARLAGRDRSKFYKLLHRHELDPCSFRTPSR